MRTQLTSLQRAIVSTLLVNDRGLSAYTLHKRFNVTAGDLVQAVDALVANELIVVDSTTLKVTPEQRLAVLALLSPLHKHTAAFGDTRSTRRDFKQPAVQIGEPVMPWIPLLDRKAFDARRQFELQKKLRRIEDPKSVEIGEG